MWISALWLPDNIMKGFRTKALLWGEWLVLIWGTKAHSPTTHNLIEHICCMLPCGMYLVQGLEYLHQLQCEIVKYTMCGGGTATTQRSELEMILELEHFCGTLLDELTPIEKCLEKAKALFKMHCDALPEYDTGEEKLDWDALKRWALSGGEQLPQIASRDDEQIVGDTGVIKNATMSEDEDGEPPEIFEEEYVDSCTRVREDEAATIYEEELEDEEGQRQSEHEGEAVHTGEKRKYDDCAPDLGPLEPWMFARYGYLRKPNRKPFSGKTLSPVQQVLSSTRVT